MLALILFFGGSLINAQQFPLTSHYVFNGYSLDPGFAGIFTTGEATFTYRKDWTSINGSPTTIRANGFGKIHPNMYLGGELLNDKVDIFNRFKANLNYTYRLQLADIQYLNFSFWGSLYQSSINLNGVNADPNDPLIIDQTKLNGTDLNAGFSLVYNRNTFIIGFGMPTLFQTKDAYLNQASGKFAFDQEMLFHISNRFKLNPDWQLQPFLMWSRTNNSPSVIDISATLFYLEKYWCTMLYRNSKLLALGIGGELYRGLSMAYSYEIGMGGINSKSGGSHEVSIGFRFGAKEKQKYVPRIKGKSTGHSGDRFPQPTEYDIRRAE